MARRNKKKKVEGVAFPVPIAGLFIVVAGGGWIQVGEERSAINHGEAVEWPPGIAHGAWTDGSTMRVILVEVPDAAIDAPHTRLAQPTEVTDLEPARGSLAERETRPEDHDQTEGEPW
ncbi:MAG: hypothetical protein U9O18_06520 [Chloroflexota bacterium]|nr:hypothetical protein [Chloroflexota bacterium]